MTARFTWNLTYLLAGQWYVNWSYGANPAPNPQFKSHAERGQGRLIFLRGCANIAHVAARNYQERTHLRVLALETSERIGTLATLQENEGQLATVGSLSLPDKQRSAQSLLPAIEALLAQSEWQPSQLDLLCVTSGPGSFTGLRIGVTTAKTFAYATGAELVEVHTLAAIAAGTPISEERSPERLWTILDAQRQEHFVANFESGWQEGSHHFPETRIVGIEQWLQELSPGDVVSGPPLGKLLEKLSGRLPVGVRIADAKDWKPRAEAVGRLGVAAYRNGSVVNAMQLVPRYYRKSAAEEKA